MRSIPLRGLRRSDGFSLIEVLVALTIIGVAMVTLVQIFSSSLRATKKSSEYTVALIHARSLMDEAYAAPSLEDVEDNFEFDDGYTATREVQEVIMETEETEEQEQTAGSAAGTPEIPYKFYEITVTVKWPPKGSVKLTGKRVIYGE